MATFSVKNVNKNAPWWWKRIEAGLLMGLVPAYTGLIMAMPLTHEEKELAIAGGAFFGGVVKTIGLCLGENITNESDL